MGIDGNQALKSQRYDRATGTARKSWFWSLCIRWGFFYAVAWTFYWGTPYIIWSLELGREWRGIPWYAFARPWFQEHILHISNADAAAYGNIIGFLYTAALAFVPALAWMLVDRKRKHEDFVYALFRTTTRYVLIAGMFGYGMPKIPPMHAPQPEPIDWAAPFGEMVDGSLMWFHLGYSPMYHLMAGIAEVGAAFLLFWRRTVPLGALIIVASMANVEMLLYSFSGQWPSGFGAALTPGQFGLMALFLLLPEIKRLLDLFIFNRPTRPRVREPRVIFGANTGAWTVFKAVAVTALVLPHIVANYRNWIDIHHKSALYGVYRVEEFARNGSTELPAAEEAKRWKLIAINNYADRVMVRTLDDSRIDYNLSVPWINVPPWRAKRAEATAAPTGTIDFLSPSAPWGQKPKPDATFNYERVAPDRLVLAGTFGGAPTTVHLRRVPNDSFPLYNPHWY